MQDIKYSNGSKKLQRVRMQGGNTRRDGMQYLTNATKYIIITIQGVVLKRLQERVYLEIQPRNTVQSNHQHHPSSMIRKFNRSWLRGFRF